MPYVRLVFQFHLECFCGGMGGGAQKHMQNYRLSMLISYGKLKYVYKQWCSGVVPSTTSIIFLWFHIRLAKMCGYTCFFLI